MSRPLICSFDQLPTTLSCPDLHALYDWIIIKPGDHIRDALAGREPDIFISSTDCATFEPAKTEMNETPVYARVKWSRISHPYTAHMYVQVQAILERQWTPKCIVVAEHGKQRRDIGYDDYCKGFFVVSPLGFVQILNSTPVDMRLTNSHFFIDPRVLGSPDIRRFMSSTLPRMLVMPRFVMHWFHVLSSPYDVTHNAKLLQSVRDDPWQHMSLQESSTLLSFCNDSTMCAYVIREPNDDKPLLIMQQRPLDECGGSIADANATKALEDIDRTVREYMRITSDFEQKFGMTHIAYIQSRVAPCDTKNVEPPSHGSNFRLLFFVCF